MGDWRVRYDGVCAKCGTTLVRGTPATWDRATRTISCIACPVQPPPPPGALRAAATLDPGVAGASARHEYERRVAKREAAISERWGDGLVARLVRAVSDEPHSTRVWAIGAAGEERLAAALEQVPGLRMLHDRRVPGTRGNLDHLVIGPAGLFVVDAKNHRGDLEIRTVGVFRTEQQLRVKRRDVSALADKMGWQVDAVRVALERAGVASPTPVTAVLCFTRASWPIFRRPTEFRGVRLQSPESIGRLLTREPVLTEDQADALIVALARQLPARQRPAS